MAETTEPRVGIDEFVKGLRAIPDFRPDIVYSYIKAHPVQPDSPRRYLFFSSASYTRNLIFKNDLFEVLALCWEVGQVSRIHNHRDQQCWMAVPVGQLKNQNYRVLDHDQEKKTCRLEPSQSFLITSSSPLEVDPHEPVHQVLNLAEFGERAVSLHIYSRPFGTCEVYQPHRATYVDVELHYTSEYGCLREGETAVRP